MIAINALFLIPETLRVMEVNIPWISPMLNTDGTNGAVFAFLTGVVILVLVLELVFIV
jgi:hypothetical protein